MKREIFFVFVGTFLLINGGRFGVAANSLIQVLFDSTDKIKPKVSTVQIVIWFYFKHLIISDLIYLMPNPCNKTIQNAQAL